MQTRSRSLTDLHLLSASPLKKEEAPAIVNSTHGQRNGKTVELVETPGRIMGPKQPHTGSLPDISCLQNMREVTVTEWKASHPSQQPAKSDSSNSSNKNPQSASPAKAEVTKPTQEGRYKTNPKKVEKTVYDELAMTAMHNDLKKLARHSQAANVLLVKIISLKDSTDEDIKRDIARELATAHGGLKAFEKQHFNKPLLSALESLPENARAILATTARDIKFAWFLWLAAQTKNIDEAEKELATKAATLYSKLADNPPKEIIKQMDDGFLKLLNLPCTVHILGNEIKRLDKMSSKQHQVALKRVLSLHMGKQSCLFLKLMELYATVVNPKFSDINHPLHNKVIELYLIFTSVPVDYQIHVLSQTNSCIWHRRLIIDSKLDSPELIRQDLAALDKLATSTGVTAMKDEAWYATTLRTAMTIASSLIFTMSQPQGDDVRRKSASLCLSALLTSYNSGWLKGILLLAEDDSRSDPVKSAIRILRDIFTTLPALLKKQEHQIAQEKERKEAKLESELAELRKKEKQMARKKKQEKQQNADKRETSQMLNRKKSSKHGHHQTTAGADRSASTAGPDPLAQQIKNTVENLTTTVPLPTYEQVLKCEETKMLTVQDEFAFVTALADQYIWICNTEIKRLTSCFQNIKAYGDQLQHGLPDSKCRDAFNQSMRLLPTINDTLPTALAGATAAINKLLALDSDKGTEKETCQQINKDNFDNMIAQYQALTGIQFNLEAICEQRRAAVSHLLQHRDSNVPRKAGLHAGELEQANAAYAHLSSSFSQWCHTFTELSQQLHASSMPEQ